MARFILALAWIAGCFRCTPFCLIAILCLLSSVFGGCSSPSIKVGPMPNVAAVISSNTETRAHIKNVDQDITKLLQLARAPVRDRSTDPTQLLLHAQSEIAFAKSSAEMTERRALVAEAAVLSEHGELKRCATENAAMRPIVAQVHKWWGIGGIAYGFVRLAKHLLILAAVIIAIGVAVLILSFFFPVIGVAFKAIGPLFGAVMSRIGSLFRRKA
jgi:hypothetical protein